MRCAGTGVLRNMTAGKVRCACGQWLWASAQAGDTLGWTPPHPAGNLLTQRP